MFRFRKEQKIFEIGKVKIGGQPGELPTVLIGSIFHEGHRIVKDRSQGIFDKQRAKHLIRLQEELSEETGIPCMLDVVGDNSDALIKFIDFVSEVTDVPFLINGQRAPVRIAASKYVAEVGLQERAVYNSINYTFQDAEAQCIKETKIKAAIIQAFNPRNPRPEGMVSLLKNENGLLNAALAAGIEKPMILTPVLDLPSVGSAAYGLYLLKDEFGIPTGTAPIGVIGRWKNIERLGKYSKRYCRAGAAAAVQAMGANFIIYGSLSKARNLFPVCAMMDAMIAYNARNYGIRPLTKNHPLYKIL